MLDLHLYLQKLISECKSVFGDRLLYLGLQGSYLRGEANENSDIDIMVLIERFSVEDMDAYKRVLKKIGHSEKSCGFICGREELACWNPLEVCQLQHTTKDLFGTLCAYLPKATREDEINYVRLGVGNLYHELCHRYIHADREKNIRKFRTTCKNLFFLIQNLMYLERGTFAAAKSELIALAVEEDREVLQLHDLPDGYDFDKAFATIFRWCQNALLRVNRIKQRGSLHGGM